jgi:hypothetical protein
MKKIIQIVDSREYVETNCYQHQLLIDLKRNFDHILIPFCDLPNSLPDDVTVLSTIKIRNVYKHIDRLASVFKNKNVLVYDQDPWETFVDTATYPGGYHNVATRIPNVEFINTSSWWSSYVIKSGFKSHFCRMGLLPEYCSYGLPFEKRETGLSFMGLLSDSRKYAIEKINEFGCPVRIVAGNRSYVEWLKWLQTQQSFIFDETFGWTIKNEPISKNIPKPKNVEIISQGCFIFHDALSPTEDVSYGLKNLPCDITYDSYSHCVELFNEFKKKPIELLNEMIIESVDKIRESNGWSDMREIVSSHVPCEHQR